MLKKGPGKGNILDIMSFENEKGEQFRTVFASSNVEIEQIASFGAPTPEGEWYDQDWNEWVLVVKGTAELAFTDRPAAMLEQGDYLLLEKHVRHRVSYASEDCIWLAVHIK